MHLPWGRRNPYRLSRRFLLVSEMRPSHQRMDRIIITTFFYSDITNNTKSISKNNPNHTYKRHRWRKSGGITNRASPAENASDRRIRTATVGNPKAAFRLSLHYPIWVAGGFG